MTRASDGEWISDTIEIVILKEGEHEGETTVRERVATLVKEGLRSSVGPVKEDEAGRFRI